MLLAAMALGKRTMVMRYLNRHEPNGNSHTLYDWCYVSNFGDTRCPKVLKLPAGDGCSFKKDIENLMKRLVKAFPLAFDNELYYSRAEKLKAELAIKQETTLKSLTKSAEERGVSVSITTQGDYQLVAMNGKEPHSEDSFAALSAEDQQLFENTINDLEVELRGIVRKLTEWEEQYSNKQQKLDENIAQEVVGQLH